MTNRELLFLLGGTRGMHPNPIVGGLHTDGQHAFVDGQGRTMLPVSLHVGDLLWQWLVKRDEVLAFLDKCEAAGIHYLRWWLLLNSRRNAMDFWTYLALGPKVVPNFYAEAVALGREITQRGMLSHISLGEYAGLSWAELVDFYHHITDDIVAGIGPHGCTLVGEINESQFNADGRSPEQVQSLVNIIRAKYPDNLYCLSHVMGTEDATTIRQWTPSWMNFFAIGGSGRGSVSAWYDIAQHHFEYGYGDPHVRRLWIEIEGEDRTKAGDFTARQWALLAASGAIGRGIPNLFLPGSARLFRDGDPSQHPAFWSVPKLLRALPRDLHRFQHLEHIGDRFAGIRPIRDLGEGTRGNYARADDGRFVLMAFTNGGAPGVYHAHAERAFTATVVDADGTTTGTITAHAGELVALTLVDGVILIGQVH